MNRGSGRPRIAWNVEEFVIPIGGYERDSQTKVLLAPVGRTARVRYLAFEDATILLAAHPELVPYRDHWVQSCTLKNGTLAWARSAQ